MISNFLSLLDPFTIDDPDVVTNVACANSQSTSRFGEWTLHEGSGRREFLDVIEYRNQDGEEFEFITRPRVVVAITQFDIIQDVGSIRSRTLHVRARRPRRESFTLQYSTWDDTKLNSASVSWFAFGELRRS